LQDGGDITEPKRLRRDQLSSLSRFPVNDRYNKSALDEYSGEISLELKQSLPSLPTAKFMESQLEDTNQTITFNESIILKKDESKPSNKLWHLKSKNHNSISFPAGISASLHDMISSIKKTKF